MGPRLDQKELRRDLEELRDLKAAAGKQRKPLKRAGTMGGKDAVSVPASLVAELLKTPLSESWWARYDALEEKRREETLTPEEGRDLRQMTEKLEEMQVERARRMVEMAGRLGISLKKLVETYSIRPR